ncbi:MAG: hypothetical protein WC916_02145 [Candidatus Woesearchaeota archaeon]
MNVQRRNSVLFSIVLVFLLAVPFVLGASIFDQVFRPLAGTNVAQTYNRYFYIVDAIIYFILFIGLAQFALGEKFKDSKTIPIMLGIILAIGAAVFELQTGFNFGKMWWFAGLLIFLMLAGAIYTIAKRFGANTLIAFSLAYIMFYLLIQSTAPVLLEKILSLDWLGAIISILFVLAIGGLIYGIVKLFKDIKSGEYKEDKARRSEKEVEGKEKKMMRAERKALEKEQQARADLEKMGLENNVLQEKEKQLKDIEGRIMGIDRLNRQEQIKYIVELETALSRANELQQSIQNYTTQYATVPPEMQGYITQLDGYITSLERVLTKLYELVKKENDLDITEIPQLEKQYDELIKHSQEDLDKLNTKVTALNSSTMKDNDPTAFTDLQKSLNEYYTKSSELAQIITHTKNAQTLINTQQNIIHTADKENLRLLEDAIRLCTQKSEDEVGKMYRGIKTAQSIADNKTDGSGIMHMVRQGKRFLSKATLQQIYGDVVQIHRNTAKANAAVTLRDNTRVEKQKLLDAYKTIEDTEIQAIIAATKTQLTAYKNHHKADLSIFAKYVSDLLTPPSPATLSPIGTLIARTSAPITDATLLALLKTELTNLITANSGVSKPCTIKYVADLKTKRVENLINMIQPIKKYTDKTTLTNEELAMLNTIRTTFNNNLKRIKTDLENDLKKLQENDIAIQNIKI